MKDPFKHTDKTFVVGENRSYIAELPHHLAHKGLPSDVARTELFKLDSRKGNHLTFKHGVRYRTPISGKVLTNPKRAKKFASLTTAVRALCLKLHIICTAVAGFLRRDWTRSARMTGVHSANSLKTRRQDLWKKGWVRPNFSVP